MDLDFTQFPLAHAAATPSSSSTGSHISPPPTGPHDDIAALSSSSSTGAAAAVAAGAAPPTSAYHHPLPPGPFAPADPKRARACESCRGLKVRCVPHDPERPKGPCRRCFKARRQCIFTQPSRKRQKKTDSKVAELEKKIDALTASLEATRKGGTHADDDDPEELALDDASSDRRSIASRQQAGARKRRIDKGVDDLRSSVRELFTGRGGGSLIAPSLSDESRFQPGVPYVDVISQQLISLDMAVNLVQTYSNEMLSIFPMIPFPPPNTPFSELRRTKPTLLLAILVVASGYSHPDLHRALHKELTRSLAERIFVNGEKSLELIETLLVTSYWYPPPETYEELKFYMIIHQAVIMSMDLGLGRPLPDVFLQGRRIFNDTDPRRNLEEAFNALNTSDPINGSARHPPAPRHPACQRGPRGPQVDPCSMESRRIHLAVFWSTSNAALTLRRPPMMRFTPFMKQSLHLLETTPSTPYDPKVAQWVRLQNLSHEVAETYDLSNPMSDLSISTPSVASAIDNASNQLDLWKNSVSPALINPALEAQWHLQYVLSNEPALHQGHNADSFRLPFSEHSLSPHSFDHSSAHIARLCRHARGHVATFADKFTSDQLANAPIFFFVRLSYVIVVCIKLDLGGVACEGDGADGDEGGEEGWEEIINRVITRMARVAVERTNGRDRAVGKFAMIMLMLRLWWKQKKKAQSEEYEDEDEDEEEEQGGEEHVKEDHGGPTAEMDWDEALFSGQGIDGMEGGWQGISGISGIDDWAMPGVVNTWMPDAMPGVGGGNDWWGAPGGPTGEGAVAGPQGAGLW